MDEREVELIDYLRVLWRQKWVIVITFAAAVAAAWGASRAISPTYQTKTSLLLLPPLSSQLDAEAVGSRLAPEAYDELAVSTSLLQTVMEKAALPGSTRIEDLKRRFSVSVRRLSSEGELLLTAAITGSNPDQLPDIAAAWTAAFAETYGELFQDRNARSYEYVSENYAETEAELEQLLEERKQLLLEHPLTALQAKLDSLQQEEINNETRLTAARREYDTITALIAALEDELARQPFTYALGRSIDPDSLVAALGAGLSTREIDALADINVETEVLNSTYISLDSQIASQRASLRQLEEEIRVREEDSTAFRDEFETLQTEITEAEAALEDYDQRIGLLRVSYSKLTSSLQDAKIALAETPEPIRVIDEPLVPRSPIAPKKSTNIAVAGFLGLMIGTLLAFFVDYLARVREQERATHPKAVPVSEEPRGPNTAQNTDTGRTDKGNEPPQPVA